MNSLSRRLATILGGALLLIAIGLLAAYRYQQSMLPNAGVRLPLPAQAAAIAQLIERTPDDQLPLLLRALNSASLRVEVVDQAPKADRRSVDLGGIGWAVRRDLDALGGRPVMAYATPGVPGEGEAWLSIVIGLRDGRYVSIQTRSGMLRYLLGARMTTAALIVLLLIGGVSLWLLRTQIRPLETVVHAVERFGEDLDTPSLDPHGAAEVRRLVQAFERMRTRIRALLDGRARLLAAIGHDLGTYLTRLRLRAEFIVDDDQRERAVRDLEEMDALIRDSLTLSRQGLDREPYQPVELEALIRSQLERFAGYGVDVRLVASQPVELTGQALALKRMLNNLVDNALKYGGSAELQLHHRPGSDEAELIVDDRGPGIPAEDRELVLEPFYRRDAARNLDKAGSGLGLAIVSDIVKRHHGRLLLEDRPGGGLRVRIRLPLKEDSRSAN